MIPAIIMALSWTKGKNGNVAGIRIYAVKAVNGVTGTGRNPFLNQVNSEPDDVGIRGSPDWERD